MSQLMRCFIAVPLSDDVIATLAHLEARLRAKLDLPLKWVSPEAMHITVKFLGDVPVGQIEEVASAARAAASDADPFALSPLGLTAFPSVQRPRTLVAALSDAEGRMARVAEDVESRAERLGFPREGRKFRPHITLARAKRDARMPSVEGLLDGYCAEDFREVWVDQLWLVQSELTPNGPIHTPMAKLPMADM